MSTEREPPDCCRGIVLLIGHRLDVQTGAAHAIGMSYRYGRSREVAFAEHCYDRGAVWVALSRGSRGPADVLVKFPRQTVLAVQVKASRARSAGPRQLSAEQAAALRAEARRLRARPIVVRMHGDAYVACNIVGDGCVTGRVR